MVNWLERLLGHFLLYVPKIQGPKVVVVHPNIIGKREIRDIQRAVGMPKQMPHPVMRLRPDSTGVMEHEYVHWITIDISLEPIERKASFEDFCPLWLGHHILEMRIVIARDDDNIATGNAVAILLGVVGILISPKRPVAQMKKRICGRNDGVDVIDNATIHFVNITKWSLAKLDDSSMSKMGICGKPIHIGMLPTFRKIVKCF